MGPVNTGQVAAPMLSLAGIAEMSLIPNPRHGCSLEQVLVLWHCGAGTGYFIEKSNGKLAEVALQVRMSAHEGLHPAAIIFPFRFD